LFFGEIPESDSAKEIVMVEEGLEESTHALADNMGLN